MRYLGIDIFSGAGGMSAGALQAGINIQLAIDNNLYAGKTYKKNHPETNFIFDDIKNVNPLNHININPFILFGGPPCQGFSLSNTRTRNDENEKNKLFKEFLRFLDVLRPIWFVFENVEGFELFNKGNTVKLVANEFKNLGYNISFKTLSASDFGVPQTRKRFFMIGNIQNVDFQFPVPLYLEKKVTVWDAICDLPILENGSKVAISNYQDIELNEYLSYIRQDSKNPTQNIVSCNEDYVIERYKYIKQGQNWRAIPDVLMQNYKNKRNCHSGIYKRLEANKPSVVIANYRKNMLIHPFQNRGLSVREAARLQSFSDNFYFEGSITHIQQQIGNAVPPLLAKAIFEAIIKQSK